VYRLIVSLRYLRSKKLNLIAVLGVAIGVMALLVVLSVMTGFDQELRQRIRGTLSDLIVEKWDPKGGDSFGGYKEDVRKLLALEHVVGCAPRFEGLAIIKMGQTYRWGQFLGIDLDLELRATDLANYYRSWLGAEALENCRARLRELEAGDLSADELAGVQEAAVAAAMKMRREDFETLSDSRRARVLELAGRRGADLKAAWAKNRKKLPNWDTGVPMKAYHAPVLAGRDLVVLGADTEGGEVVRQVGERLVLTTIGDNPFDPRVKVCHIAGKFKSGMYEYDLRNVYMPLEKAQDLAQKPGEVTSINLRLDDYRHAGAVRCAILGIPSLEELRRLHGFLSPAFAWVDQDKPDGRLKELLESHLDDLSKHYAAWQAMANPRLPAHSMQLRNTYFQIMDLVGKAKVADRIPHYEQAKALRKALELRDQRSLGRTCRVSTWEDKRRNILRAVSVERRVMAVILLFMVVLAGFLILAILYTTVMEKTRDIGILKSIGGTVGGIMSIFLLNGFLIGIVGAALGTALGVFLCNKLNEIEDIVYDLTEWRVFPRDIYSLDRIPVDKDPFWSIVIIATTAIVISFLAAVYPAWKAARMKPVEALGYE